MVVVSGGPSSSEIDAEDVTYGPVRDPGFFCLKDHISLSYGVLSLTSLDLGNWLQAGIHWEATNLDTLLIEHGLPDTDPALHRLQFLSADEHYRHWVLPLPEKTGPLALSPPLGFTPQPERLRTPPTGADWTNLTLGLNWTSVCAFDSARWSGERLRAAFNQGEEDGPQRLLRYLPDRAWNIWGTRPTAPVVDPSEAEAASLSMALKIVLPICALLILAALLAVLLYCRWKQLNDFLDKRRRSSIKVTQRGLPPTAAALNGSVSSSRNGSLSLTERPNYRHSSSLTGDSLSPPLPSPAALPPASPNPYVGVPSMPKLPLAPSSRRTYANLHPSPQRLGPAPTAASQTFVRKSPTPQRAQPS